MTKIAFIGITFLLTIATTTAYSADNSNGRRTILVSQYQTSNECIQIFPGDKEDQPCITVRKDSFDLEQIASEDIPKSTTAVPSAEILGEIEIIPGSDLFNFSLSQGFQWGRRRRLLASGSSQDKEDDSSSETSSKDNSSSEEEEDDDDKSGSEKNNIPNRVKVKQCTMCLQRLKKAQNQLNELLKTEQEGSFKVNKAQRSVAKNERMMAKFCKPFLLPSVATKEFDKKGEIQNFFGKDKNLIFKIFDKYLLYGQYVKKPLYKQLKARLVIKAPKPNEVHITVFHITKDVDKSKEDKVLRDFNEK